MRIEKSQITFEIEDVPELLDDDEILMKIRPYGEGGAWIEVTIDPDHEQWGHFRELIRVASEVG